MSPFEIDFLSTLLPLPESARVTFLPRFRKHTFPISDASPLSAPLSMRHPFILVFDRSLLQPRRLSSVSSSSLGLRAAKQAFSYRTVLVVGVFGAPCFYAYRPCRPTST